MRSAEPWTTTYCQPGRAASVLAERGNCSSATVLLVLEQLRAAARPRSGRPGVLMAFGPGLTLYAALLAG